MKPMNAFSVIASERRASIAPSIFLSLAVAAR
jgi:hypothetical protein